MNETSPRTIDERPASLDPRQHPALTRYRACPDFEMCIGGIGVGATGRERIAVEDPASEQTIAFVPAGDASDVDDAVQAATQAGRPDSMWTRMAGLEREAILHRLAARLAEQADELAHLLVLENGKLLAAAQREVQGCVQYTRYAAGWASKITGETIDASAPEAGRGRVAYTRREPVGVVAGITAWNMPLSMAVWKAIPALACGCTVVLSPAIQTPLSSLRLAELALEAGVPPGVLNVVTGLGHVTGAALARHPGAQHVSFTGSTAVGREVGQAAAANLATASLELGGKSPVIVFADADLERVIPAVFSGIFYNQGQVCAAGSRLYVERPLFDQVVDAVSERAEQMRLGSGLDPRAELGPLVSAQHKQRVTEHIERARRAGARITAGGRRVEATGHFVEPTVFADVRQEMDIVQQEVFGPVLVAMPFDQPTEALALANDSAYALSGSVYTQDIDRAHQLIPKLNAGVVYVNAPARTDPALPFGGRRASGHGREHGRAIVDTYTVTKSVVISYRA